MRTATTMSTTLPFTGERFVPGAAEAIGEMWFEHWHRYHYISAFVAGKAVLDVACGEGYGAALISKAAHTVDGVDISSDAIRHAKERYSARGNLTFHEASCAALPFADATFDVVVSFETIEHIHEQTAFLDEVKRVLKADGLFIISSPNKAEYTDKRQYQNEFHVSELYRPELEALLTPRFAHLHWLGQRNVFVSHIAPETSTDAPGVAMTVSAAAPETAAQPLAPVYYLIFAANRLETLQTCRTPVSTFTDTEEWIFEDYRKTYKMYQQHARREIELDARCKALEAELADLKVRLAAAGAPAVVSPATDPIAGESWLARTIKRLSQ